MPELIVQAVSLEYLVKFSSHRRKDAVIQHLAYRTFKAHAENVVRIHVLEIRSWVLVLFLDQMLSVVVSKDEEEKAREVLEKAWDSFWEDGDGWCYGNYLEDKLVNAGIAFDAYYADAEE